VRAEDTGTTARRDFELARLAAIVESSADAIIGKTLDGVITNWNAGAEHMYGYTAGEMVGRNVAELIPADHAGELAPILAQLRRGERVEHFETQRCRQDGSIIDVSVSISPIRDTTGVVVGASTVARDITERNQAEVERRALERELHQSERLEILGQLASGIAHDFNNLLAAILSYAGFVAEETGDRPAVRADAEQIQTMAQRAARLTKQLLIFSRREVTQPEALDLNLVIAGIRDLLSASTGPHITLRVHPADQLAAIMADRGQIEQVLLNLAINARDAMPDGGTLTVQTLMVELHDWSARQHPGVGPGRYVELTVGDTGTGMSAEVAARIFEPFFSTKPAGHSTGLGLSTVQSIVTQAGGSVSAHSGKATGTTFRVCFPASAAAAEPGPAGAVPGDQGNWETVLIVDDEPSVVQVTSRILRKNGYTTLEAGTGDQALLLAASQDFQLLLTDSVMPGVSGPKLAERITALKPGVRILHMSGYTAGLLSPAGIAERAFMQKPFTAEALLEKVRTMLDTPPPDPLLQG
jgi:two-component system, cell cycle sensor histidine kinase and response regulator CckA